MSSEPPLPSRDPGDSLPPLPELNTTLLDAEQVEQLFRDLEVCAQIIEIIPKFAANRHVAETGAITLTEAHQLLLTRAIRGLQFRYRYEGAEWWDTLMVLGDQFRLVRIRHDFSDRGP